jgi:hypothetical protein
MNSAPMLALSLIAPAWVGFYFHGHKPGLPRWLSGKESACQCRRRRRLRRGGFNPWVRKIPWNRKWQPAPVFLPGKFHRQRSLVGYSPWGHKESDTAEHTRRTNLRYTNLPPEDYTCSFPGIAPTSIPTARPPNFSGICSPLHPSCLCTSLV